MDLTLVAEIFKANTWHDIYSIDPYPIAVCDNTCQFS